MKKLYIIFYYNGYNNQIYPIISQKTNKEEVKKEFIKYYKQDEVLGGYIKINDVLLLENVNDCNNEVFKINIK